MKRELRQAIPEPGKRPMISQVLKEKRDWKITEEQLPEVDKAVVIRLCHKTELTGETPWEKFPLEDVKIGYYSGEKWFIYHPFPKYDYSPLSNKENIKENVDVTHWAETENGELEGWLSRFDRIGTYKTLELKVDPENEEIVYKALAYGSYFISQFGGEEYHKAKSGEGLKRYQEILFDLQQCIDIEDNIEMVHPHIRTMITDDTIYEDDCNAVED